MADSPPPLVGRGPLLTALAAAVEAAPLVLLVGPAGVGRSAVAAAVAGPDALTVSLAGCEETGDVLRAVGAALGAVPSGVERAVLEKLGDAAPLCLVADDTTGDDAVEQLQGLVVSVAGLRVIAVVEEGTVDTELPGRVFVPIGPLSDDDLASAFPAVDAKACRGSPLMAELSAGLGVPPAEVPALLARALGDGALPMGIPGAPPPGTPASALRADPRRTTLRAGVRAMLPGGAGSPGPQVLAQALAAVTPLLPLAHGEHVGSAPDPRDILLLRALSRLVHATDGTRCAAAAARLLTAAGQVDLARALLRAHPDTTGMGRGMLGWADGEALLASGDVDGALARWREAAEQFRRAGARTTRAQLLRRAADRLGARHLLEAESLYRLARNAYRAANDRTGVAAALRGIADLSVANGELVSASTLHDEVDRLLGDLDAASPAARLERANLLLGQATLSLARGELARAERILDALAPTATDHPLVAANVARRRVELWLRRGRTREAYALARTTADAYAALGEPVAQAKTLRLAAEAAAADGAFHRSIPLLDRALELQIGAQDLPGLARTLGRLALVEAARGDPLAARRRREQEAAVRAAMAP